MNGMTVRMHADGVISHMNGTLEAPVAEVRKGSSLAFVNCDINSNSNRNVNGSQIRMDEYGQNPCAVLLQGSRGDNNNASFFFSARTEQGGSFYADDVNLQAYAEDAKDTFAVKPVTTKQNPNEAQLLTTFDERPVRAPTHMHAAHASAAWICLPSMHAPHRPHRLQVPPSPTATSGNESTGVVDEQRNGETTGDKDDGGGLGLPAIIGIVAAVLVAALAGLGYLVYRRKQRKERKRGMHGNGNGNGKADMQAGGKVRAPRSTHACSGAAPRMPRMLCSGC
jgi:hypothetical protein